jgi:hypothetical protein
MEMFYHHCFSTLLYRICHYKGARNQVGLKLKGTQQLLAFADNVNLLGDDIHPKKKHGNFN